jgi:hypothetical protein
MGAFPKLPLVAPFFLAAQGFELRATKLIGRHSLLLEPLHESSIGSLFSEVWGLVSTSIGLISHLCLQFYAVCWDLALNLQLPNANFQLTNTSLPPVQDAQLSNFCYNWLKTSKILIFFLTPCSTGHRDRLMSPSCRLFQPARSSFPIPLSPP